MILHQLIDSASQITYRAYTSIGFIMGSISALITSNIVDITMSFVVGASGALGAAFIKYVIDRIKKSNEKEDEGPFDDEYETYK